MARAPVGLPCHQHLPLADILDAGAPGSPESPRGGGRRALVWALNWARQVIAAVPAQLRQRALILLASGALALALSSPAVGDLANLRDDAPSVGIPDELGDGPNDRVRANRL